MSLDISKLDGRVALITGGNRGLGFLRLRRSLFLSSVFYCFHFCKYVRSAHVFAKMEAIENA